jgi:hypothetical protein
LTFEKKKFLKSKMYHWTKNRKLLLAEVFFFLNLVC